MVSFVNFHKMAYLELASIKMQDQHILFQDFFKIYVKISGHTDVVRQLEDFPEMKYFVSASNDATIKVWSYTGDCLNTYYGHANYIYR